MLSSPLYTSCKRLAKPVNTSLAGAFINSRRDVNQLTVENVNQNFVKLEYAVRGRIPTRALQIKRELKEGKKYPFKSVIFSNIGDVHATGQSSITFIRQVLSCCADTSLLSSPNVPNDVKERVEEILSYCDGKSIGSYSETAGVEIIRRHIADYIEDRDKGNVKVDYQDILMCSGATQGVKSILAYINETRIPGKKVGVMVPIPQYPLYSATICEFGMHLVDYYLDEESEWRLDIDELKRAYKTNIDKCDIRAIVIINPGNPTGSVLTEENIKEILDFANEYGLMVIADEVYQHNVYAENSKFHSVKKVMSQKTDYNFELASLMSSSKGFVGECGLRGGYMELYNFQPEVRGVLVKAMSSWLCPSILGQITMDCVVKPPSGESLELFTKEKNTILGNLKYKAKLVADTFSSIEGIRSSSVSGAMYVFPRLSLSEKAIEKAKTLGLTGDTYYALKLLETAGIASVPGSGFGQLPNTHHIRLTILPPPDVFEDLIERFKKFHSDFQEQHS